MSPKLPHKKKKMFVVSGSKEIRDRQDDRQQSRMLSPFGEQQQSKLRSYIHSSYMEDSVPFRDSHSRLN